MTPKNLLFISSDEHTQEFTGCCGNPIVQAAVLDRLAAGYALAPGQVPVLD